MTDITKALMEESAVRHRKRRSFFVILALLCSVTVGAVFWQLHQTGISATSDVVCGLDAHVHSEDCYEAHFICGLEEGQVEFAGHTHGPECFAQSMVLQCGKEAHVHTDACYTEERIQICTQEEHSHEEACYDAEGVLVCGLEFHAHEDSCYTVERRLTCTLEPHEHDDSCWEEAETLTCTQEETPPILHTHTDACRETTLVCTLPEHTHDDTCISDLTADVETTEMLRQNAANPGTGIWNTDLLAVAQAQLGYQESSRNFVVDEDGVRHGYTRYGEAYGDPYGPWNGMFLAYCLRYSGVPESVAPQRGGIYAMRTECAESPWKKEVGAANAQPGDIVFFEDTAGIVSLGGETLRVICGDVSGSVQEQTVSAQSVIQWIAVGEAYAATALPIQAPVDDGFTLPEEESTENDSLDAAQSGAKSEEDQQQGNAQSENDPLPSESVDLSQGCSLNATLLKWDGNDWTSNFEKDKMLDGDKIKFGFTYEIPYELRGSSPTAYYTIPNGILPSKTTGVIYNPSDNTQIGTYTIADGVVRFTYDADFWNTGSAIGGRFEMEGELDRSQLGDDAKITFPGTGEMLDVKGYIKAEKTASKRFDGDDVVFRYTILVSTKNSTGPGTVTISDSLNANDKSLRGYYVTDSIRCYDQDDKEISLTVGNNLNWKNMDTDKPSFEITGLPALTTGKTYRVVYDVRIPKESFDDYSTNSVQYVRIYNSAKASSRENSWTDNDWCTFSQRIKKDGVYERSTGRIKWTITVNNPGDQRQYLTGYRLWDALPQDVKIVSDVSVYAENTDGTPFETISAQDFQNRGFLFEETTQPCNNYIFVFYTDIPASDSALNLTNTANLEKGDTTFRASKQLNITAGDWEASKTLLRTDSDVAYWSFYAVNSTGSKDFTVTDTIGSREGTDLYPLDHYGVASEIQSAIEKNLRIEMQNGTVLSYHDAESALKIEYLDSDGNTLSLAGGGNVAKFRITFQGESVKSIALAEYPTHMVRASVLLGHTRHFYNTLQVGQSTFTAQSEYKNEKAFEKLVSTDGGTTFTWGGTADYTEDMTLLYRLELQVAAGVTDPVYDTLPDGCSLEGTPTVTVDGGAPSDIVPTVNGNRLTFAIADCLPDGNAHRLVIQYRIKLAAADWADKTKAEAVYTNSARWGQETESVSTTVKREIPPLEKAVEITDNQSGLVRRVKYTVYVNLGMQDFKKDYLSLRDTISMDTSKVKVELDLSSVNLAYYDYATNSQTSLPEGTYEILESNSSDCLLKVKVPNRTAMVLTYECTFTLLSSGEHQIQNRIEMEDIERYNSSIPIKLSTDAASAYAGQLKIYKVDQLGKALGGAVFEAVPYENGNWTPGGSFPLTESPSGTFAIGVSSDGANNTLKVNTLYRIWEYSAPVGYIRDETSRYILFYNTSEQEARNMTASFDIDETVRSAIQYTGHTEVMTIKVENSPEKLVIQKQWMDADNKPLSNPGVDSINVELLRKTDSGQDSKFSVNISLNESNGWKYTIEIGENGYAAANPETNEPYLYYVKEKNAPQNWHVTYLNNDGVRTGTIYVQNRVYSFELPKTGGIGTERFLYIGGAMVLCSGLLLRKRGKRK